MGMQLACRDLSLGYENTVVVEKLNFTVNSGDYLCIVGENGAGKSTLVKTLLRLKAPVSGVITPGDGIGADDIGYLPQQTVVQKDFPASVREIVLSGCLNRCGARPFYTKREKARADEAMAKLDIASLSGRCYRELSGGQQQRVLLARALCATQKMLLLDEPAAGLDPKATSALYELIAKLNHEGGVTVLMVSHDIHGVLRYASHILHIGKQPLFFGTKEQYLESDAGKVFTAAMGGAFVE